ncbi:Thiol:disulfide interchange protein DsbE [Novipirellula galeiformis]|uniref:Thiol:disulfide interchange protein DsbE n=1 Tax=Novipirellula galeiformis TaxID=2528004 RepID=A0A5C6CCH8_9BACT|nr:TlpA family protein disulfide reductase [Novipirellula galeiformis]TWU22503.1 Thiol:disulfide interchange protein DsbE [Novipirellula galeiformis]
MNQNSRQPSAKRAWWPVGLLILAFGLFAVSRNRPSSQDSVAIGKPAPQLELVRLSVDPAEMTLETMAEGKVALIHLWGTWCGPCKMEYPHLAEMAREFETNDAFEFISISCEAGSSETIEGLTKKTREYLGSIAASTEVFADPRGTTRLNVAERLEKPHMYFPTTILVDRKGTIRGVWEGYSPNGVEQMKVQIEQWL